MKQIIITIAIAMAFTACHPSGGTTPASPAPGTPGTSGDSTFNGSYIQLVYNGKTYTIKDVSVPVYGHFCALSTSYTGSVYIMQIVNTGNNLYGISRLVLGFYYSGTGIGSFPVYPATSNLIIQQSPANNYSDTSGTVTVTYSGSDYIQGTINTTIYGSGVTYPTTGSFKIYH